MYTFYDPVHLGPRVMRDLHLLCNKLCNLLALKIAAFNVHFPKCIQTLCTFIKLQLQLFITYVKVLATAFVFFFGTINSVCCS